MKRELTIRSTRFIECYPRPTKKQIEPTGGDRCGKHYPTLKEDPYSRTRWHKVTTNAKGAGTPRYCCSVACANQLMAVLKAGVDDGVLTLPDWPVWELINLSLGRAKHDLGLTYDVPVSAAALVQAFATELRKHPEFAGPDFMVFIDDQGVLTNEQWVSVQKRSFRTTPVTSNEIRHAINEVKRVGVKITGSMRDGGKHEPVSE